MLPIAIPDDAALDAESAAELVQDRRDDGPGRAARELSARGMLRGVEPDSLLVRGLVDNASRGLSPALDRSTTFERVAGRQLALRTRARARRG